MKKSFITRSIYFVALVLIFACSKSETPDPNSGSGSPKITINGEQNIQETEFTTSWSVNKTGISSIKIQVSSTEEFTDIIKDIPVPISNTSVKVSGLTGATIYYYKVIMSFSDNSSLTSSVEAVTMGFNKETITFTTSDGLTLSAEIAYLASITNPKPGLILMHGFRLTKERWTVVNMSKIRNEMVAKGYVCLAFDFRGHGDSDDYDLDIIFNDLVVNAATVSKDLIAAIDYMKNHNEVDGEKIALLGESYLGGNMAIAGNGYNEVKASVAITPSRVGINSIFPNLSINSVFYIAGDTDKRPRPYGDSEAESVYLHGISNAPKKINIVSSGEHGQNLLTDVPTLEDEIIEWIDTHINL